jgi:hypothetical protein
LSTRGNTEVRRLSSGLADYHQVGT